MYHPWGIWFGSQHNPVWQSLINHGGQLTAPRHYSCTWDRQKVIQRASEICWGGSSKVAVHLRRIHESFFGPALGFFLIAARENSSNLKKILKFNLKTRIWLRTMWPSCRPTLWRCICHHQICHSLRLMRILLTGKEKTKQQSFMYFVSEFSGGHCATTQCVLHIF